MGDPDLHRVAADVQGFATAELRELVQELWDTMEARGGVGLAAPQIGVSLRVVVFAMAQHPRFPDVPPVPRTVLVNPRISPLDQTTTEGWEGCLSLPGLRGLVTRYRRVRYSGWDGDGKVVEREAEGFHARVVQHECDHLDGILYPQRMDDLGEFGFEEEISLSGRFPGFQC